MVPSCSQEVLFVTLNDDKWQERRSGQLGLKLLLNSIIMVIDGLFVKCHSISTSR